MRPSRAPLRERAGRLWERPCFPVSSLWGGGCHGALCCVPGEGHIVGRAGEAATQPRTEGSGVSAGNALEFYPGLPNRAGVPSHAAEASPRLTPRPLGDSSRWMTLTSLLPGLGLGDLEPLGTQSMDTERGLRHTRVVGQWPGNQSPRLNKGPHPLKGKFRNKPAQNSSSCPVCLSASK